MYLRPLSLRKETKTAFSKPWYPIWSNKASYRNTEFTFCSSTFNSTYQGPISGPKKALTESKNIFFAFTFSTQKSPMTLSLMSLEIKIKCMKLTQFLLITLAFGGLKWIPSRLNSLRWRVKSGLRMASFLELKSFCQPNAFIAKSLQWSVGTFPGKKFQNRSRNVTDSMQSQTSLQWFMIWPLGALVIYIIF